MKGQNFRKILIGVTCGLLILIVTIGGGRLLTNGGLAIREPVSKAIFGIKNTINIRGIIRENTKLKEEVNRLTEENLRQTTLLERESQLKELSQIFEYEIQDKDHIVAADVTGSDTSNWMEVFVINKGTNHGIKKDNVVIYGANLVGKVVDIGKTWAKVSSYQNKNSKISFQVESKEEEIGLAGNWKGNQLSGYMLNEESKVRQGDQVITSGIGTYPQGLNLGKVIKVAKEGNEEKMKLTIEPEVSVKTLKIVGVII